MRVGLALLGVLSLIAAPVRADVVADRLQPFHGLWQGTCSPLSGMQGFISEQRTLVINATTKEMIMTIDLYSNGKVCGNPQQLVVHAAGRLAFHEVQPVVDGDGDKSTQNIVLEVVTYVAKVNEKNPLKDIISQEVLRMYNCSISTAEMFIGTDGCGKFVASKSECPLHYTSWQFPTTPAGQLVPQLDAATLIGMADSYLAGCNGVHARDYDNYIHEYHKVGLPNITAAITAAPTVAPGTSATTSGPKPTVAPVSGTTSSAQSSGGLASLLLLCVALLW